MAYVPPALRRKQQATEPGSALKSDIKTYEPATIDLPSLDDIQKHFWPTLTETHNSSVGSSAQEIDPTESGSAVAPPTMGDRETRENNAVASRKPHSTLNATEEEPDKLRYILLFRDAHPRWNEEGIIYVKTDLHLLPQTAVATAIDNAPSLSIKEDIMVYEQHADFISQVSSRARFRFLGFYHLKKVQLLEPKSPELVRMLEQKWTRTNNWGKSRQIQRDSKGWQQSLSYRWAVLKFEKVDQADSRLSAPKIKISHPNGPSHGEENLPILSVNELLRGLRLKAQSKTGTEGDEKVDM